MRMLSYISSFVFLACTLCACGGDSDGPKVEPNTSTFEISSSELTQDMTADAGYVLVPITTTLDYDKWSVSCADSWCQVAKDKSNAGILISVYASEEPEVRETSVKVESSVNDYTIKVRQLGYGPAILIKEEKPSFTWEGGELDIVVTTNVEYTIQLPSDADWIAASSKSRGFVEYQHPYEVTLNASYSKRQATIVFKANDYDVTAQCVVSQAGKTSSIDDVEMDEDIKHTPSSATANQQQSGYEIKYSYDGKIDAGHYHSPWSGKTVWPVILEYFFTGSPSIDYIDYYPRMDGGSNGRFGELNLYAKTAASNGEYELVLSYDCKMSSTVSRISMPSTLQGVQAIKFEVLTGQGDGEATYASCTEMEFYEKNAEKTLEAQLLTVFTDLTCSELKPGVTTEMIDLIPGYFATLAVELFNNTYDEWEKEFRIREYSPYSDVVEWSSKLFTRKYGNLDNPTGIYVDAGDEIVVCVGSMGGHQVSLQCVSDYQNGDYLQTRVTGGETYSLNEGINKLTFSNSGQLFVMYTATPTDDPIKIHIPLSSGKVTGFFDLETHQTDAKYKELLAKATHKYFCVKGERIMFYFHRTKMQAYVPNEILSAINLWDDFIYWQHELMGLDEYRPKQFNNHIFAISPEGSYMWATDYCVGFVYTYLENILLKEKVMAAEDNAWGPAHEIGHVNQIAIDWASSTESSNNLFSNYTIYKLGKYYSRGSGLIDLAESRFGENDPWCTLGEATHQNEDTEIHMRMNWQLWNYYHRCGYNTNFWPTLFKLMREEVGLWNDTQVGTKQLEFAKMASKAANENLTDFFDLWGFFTPVDITLSQYGTYSYKVTTAMIDAAKEYMAQFPDPKHAFQYIEDRKTSQFSESDYRFSEVGDVGHYELFENGGKAITGTYTASYSNREVSVSGGSNAVAFEVRKGAKADGDLLYFSNFLRFTIPSNISVSGAGVFAVQSTGERILITTL